MKKVLGIAAALVLLCLGSLAQAVTIATVPVGNAGNAADNTGYGSVAYGYNIGKYEVTAGQYTEFLNAKAKTDTYGLYNTYMDTAVYSTGCNIKRTGASGNYSYSVASAWANRPVNCVSYWDSCRFANWLGNGQGANSTETGAYTLTPTGMTNNTITRNAGANWAVTSENEWYKAAYYKGGSANAGYWLYPTKSNTAPANRVLGTDPGNSANYYNNDFSINSPYYRTNVGEFENSASAYGTFDQGGNVWEWNEAIPSISESNVYHGLRGGAWNDDGYYLRYRGYSLYPNSEWQDMGFRVSQAVPEPSPIIGLLGGLTGLVGLRLRRA